ncbi:hypothetical protein QAD02_004266 [Eretmocerus hayati]|uniref:Uncharacterized protein n=1 Tax=Eretmocerus hayati TaxID=131215 RepID=A0ACC2NTX4_9HYME|nr:hypothetical protein QAD02_004266 [Eretmocerus hayati]
MKLSAAKRALYTAISNKESVLFQEIIAEDGGEIQLGPLEVSFWSFLREDERSKVDAFLNSERDLEAAPTVRAVMVMPKKTAIANVGIRKLKNDLQSAIFYEIQVIIHDRGDWHSMMQKTTSPQASNRRAKRKRNYANTASSTDDNQEGSGRSKRERAKLSQADEELARQLSENHDDEELDNVISDRLEAPPVQGVVSDGTNVGEDADPSVHSSAGIAPGPEGRSWFQSGGACTRTIRDRRSRSPSMRSHPTTPLPDEIPSVPSEIDSIEPMETDEVEQNQSLRRKIARRDKKIVKLTRKIVELEAELSKLRLRKMDYPLPTGDYVLPDHIVARSPNSNAKDFAKFMIKKVFTREERSSCSLYGGRVASNEYETKPALPVEKMNAILSTYPNFI